MASLSDLFKNPTHAELMFAERYSKLPFSGQRERSFEAFAQTGLPSRRVEAWKYSDLRNALLTLPDGAEKTLPVSAFSGTTSDLTLRFTETGLHISYGEVDGVAIRKRTDPLALSGAEDSPVAALGAALSDAPHMLVIDITRQLETPLHIVFENTAAVQFSRIAILVREGASATILESHLAGSGFSNNVLEYTLEHGTSVNRVIFQDATGPAVQVFTALVQLASSAEFVQHSLGFGAKLCRNETRVFHQGTGAKAHVNSAYLLSEGRHYDQTSLVRHSMPSCVTRQLCKGAVLDGAHAVFQGKFHVARKGQHTDAEMAHNALILENGGSVDAKPELEIYADDVECAHGNTVGALDSDALFYIRQRGLSERAARALLTEAFILDTFDGLRPDLADGLSDKARNWLEGTL